MIDHNIFPESKLIVAIFHGNVSSQQLHEFIDELLNIDFTDSDMRGLVVLCEDVKPDGLDYKQILSAGRKMSNAKFRNNGKNAIVARTLLGYGLSRTYQVATEIVGLDEVKVYKGKDLAEAIEWLGVGHLSSQIDEIVQRCEPAFPVQTSPENS